jgi:hypothetical protein
VSPTPRRPTIASILVLILSCLVTASPSSLSPRGTKVEQRIAEKNSGWWARTVMALGHEGVLHFSEPVHEEITSMMFGCEDGCNDLDIATEFAGDYAIAGVRWNDDPPFRMQPGGGQHTSCNTAETIRFTTQPRCWYELFQNAKKQAERGEVPSASSHAPLLARSHFGDLQFFHSMASHDGELASETQRRVMMWAEFCWKVATKQYKLDTKLKDVDIAGFDAYFGNSGWTVQDLFTAGNPAMRLRVTDVAFGSVLHMVEDSFAEGHVEREQTSSGNCSPDIPLPTPPRILEFHSYAHQDEKKHKEQDARDAFERKLSSPMNVVAVGKPLVNFLDEGAKWEAVRPYFACVFTLIEPSTPASAGKQFASR